MIKRRGATKRASSLLALALILEVIGFFNPNNAHAVTELSIAYQGPLTGGESYFGIPQLDGVKYAISKFNSSSKDFKINLVEVDDRGDPSVAADVAPVISNNTKIIGLVGPAFSGSSIASYPYYKSSNLTTISPSASRENLTTQIGSNSGDALFHRIVSINFGTALAKNSIKNITSPKVFIIDASDNLNQSSFSALKNEFVKSKVTIVGQDTISTDVKDFTAPIAKIKATGANVITFVGYSDYAALFVKQLRVSGSNAIFSVGSIDFDKSFINLSGTASEGARITSSVPEDIGSISSTLEQDFIKVTGKKSGRYSLEAIDATNVFLNCISSGATTRSDIHKCVNAYKGKTLIGAEVSFNEIGEVIGNYSYLAEVVNSEYKYSDPLSGETTTPTTPISKPTQIDITSISSRTISPGEAVTWTFNVSVEPSCMKAITAQLVDVNGQTRYIYTDITDRYKGCIVEQAETNEFKLTLFTHSKLSPGKYTLANFCVEGSKQDCVTDPKYSSRFNGSRINRELDLSDYSFEVKDPGSTVKADPLTISKISTRKSSYSPGETINFEVEAVGKMPLNNTWINLSFGTSVISAYCQINSAYNCSYSQDYGNGNTKINFSIAIPEDLPPGKLVINQIYLASSSSNFPTSENTNNNSAYWTTAFNYYDKTVRGDSYEELKGIPSIDFSKYVVTILDSGGEPNRTPTWSNLSWVKNKVNAGDTATLNIDINGYRRYITNIWLSSLATNGNSIGYKSFNAVRLKPDASTSVYPLAKSGTYQLQFSIPRSTKPGIYKIGQLTVDSSTCSANNPDELKLKMGADGTDCYGLSSWQTTYYSNYLKSEPWDGYEKTGALTLEILPAATPTLPTLTVVSNEASTLKINYPYDYEINCEFTSDQGKLLHQRVINGESTDGINHLIIQSVKPDSKVILSGVCTGSDGVVGEKTSVEFKSAKPYPPAAPKLSMVESGADYAIFDFNYREGYKYDASSSSGSVLVSNGKIQISNLDPDTPVSVTIKITDSYEQTTLADPYDFKTKLPAAPTAPNIELVSKTQNKLNLKIDLNLNLEYEFGVDKGTVTISGSRISISDLNPGEVVIFSGTATDKYKQSVPFKATYQTALPSAPRPPVLVTKSISSSELNLNVTLPANSKLVVTASAGLVSIDGGSIKITKLNPKSTVIINAYIADAYGQNSTTASKTITTSAASPQKSITCTNGKSTKIVLGANPVCPTGYKKK